MEVILVTTVENIKKYNDGWDIVAVPKHDKGREFGIKEFIVDISVPSTEIISIDNISYSGMSTGVYQRFIIRKNRDVEK